MSVVRGSVRTEVGGMEFLTRYSMNAQSDSILSSLEEFKEQERFSVSDKHWNMKQLRVQIKQRNMESLYKRYDDKLRLGYLSIFLIVMIVMSTIHLSALFLSTDYNKSDIVPLICYILQAAVPIPFVTVLYIEKITKSYLWMQTTLSIILIVFLLVVDILVPVLTDVLSQDNLPLRPAYYTNTLLVCYIFLPITNNLLALIIGILVSVSYVALLTTVTYLNDEHERLHVYQLVGGDVLYFCAVNLLGWHFRYMNEIISRRSFLDRRNCLESTLKLNAEKEQEERLLLSILPQHIAFTVRDDIKHMTQLIKSEHESSPINDSRHSKNLYISEHDNVSILYADIVNYTVMSTQLPPKVLVETLNELFAKFDEAAEDNDVLRIKFLGDCYYCVSGVPKPNPQHAKSCVDLGLEMISIIKDVREKRHLDIDMRIGVHSGKILSGVIGIRKWQYDIWSKDVTIANTMESTGKPGKVHITKKTLEELKEYARDYIIEPNYEASMNPLLAQYKIETFLISNPSRQNDEYFTHRIQYKRPSVGVSKLMRKGVQKSKADFANPRLSRSRSTFIDNNYKMYRRMMREADVQMSDIIDQMPSGIWGKYSNDKEHKETFEKEMSGRTLFFLNAKIEKEFINEPDLLFKYYMATSLVIFLITIMIQIITIKTLSWKTMLIDGVLGIMLLVLQPLNWMKFFWEKRQHRTPPANKFLSFLYHQSESLVRSPGSRSVLYIFVSLMLATSSFINLTECKANQPEIDNCIPAWQLAQAIFLNLLLGYLFSRVFFLIKWTIGVIIGSFYLAVVWDLKSDVFETATTWNYNLNPQIAQTLAIVFLAFTLHLIDRQTEFRSRLDYRWKRKLIEKQTDAMMMKFENNTLLYNILPVHVADKYLNASLLDDDLYYEEYECISVMFASLTDYRFDEDESVVSESKLLKYLNYLISDFDKLLFSANDRRLKVEKIKMAGWTYMAACGLDPGQHRTSVVSDNESQSSNLQSNRFSMYRSQQSFEDEMVLRMVEFAASMNEILIIFNKSTFQQINLKIGISHGEVTAGVVGSSKPLYDIWGHAVNMSSRMASTGIPGKIQVTENTAIALDRQGILTQYRGKTFVKGAGYIDTYWVPLDENCQLIDRTTAYNSSKNPACDTSDKTVEEVGYSPEIYVTEL